MKKLWMVPAAALVLMLVGPSSSMAAGGGNSDAAHACQQGGYLNLYRSDHTAFKNVGACVSYAAHGGEFVTKKTATLTNIVFSACNDLTLGYTLDAASQDLVSKPYGCFDSPESDQVIQYWSDQTLVLFLRDNTCGDTYDQYGNHATTIGTNPYEVDITDSGAFCDEIGPRPPAPEGNVSLTETIA